MSDKQDKPTRIAEYSDLHEKGVRYFYDNYWKSGEENARFRRGKHWDEQQTQAIENDDRIAYSMPIIEAKGNAIVSQQLLSPYDIIALAENPEHELTAEIKNALFKHEYNRNNLKYIFSEWYQDGLFKKYGAIKRIIDRDEDPDGSSKIEKLLYNQVIWDINCKRFEIAEFTNWMQEYEYVTRDQLEQEYGFTKEEVSTLVETLRSESSTDTGGLGYYQQWLRTDAGKDLIKIVTHYQRCWKKKWWITFNDGTSKEQEEEVEIIEVPREQYSIDAKGGKIYPVAKYKRLVEYIDVCKFVKNNEKELESWIIASKKMPIHIFFSNFDDGEFWTLYDLIKQPMKFLDRVTAQVDASLRKMIKNSYQVFWNNITPEDKDNWEEIAKKLLAGGGFIRGLDPNKPVIQAINSGNIPIEILNLWKFLIDILDLVTGGVNLTGQNAKGGVQSGYAIDELKESGQQQNYLYMYNFGRAVKDFGEGWNEDINEIYGDAVDKIILVTNDDLDEKVREKLTKMKIYKPNTYREGKGYLTINKDGKFPLGEARTNIIIDKGEYTPTVRAKRLRQWMVINEMRIKAGQQPYPSNIWIGDMDIDSTIKAKALAWDEEQAKKAEQMQLAQMSQGMTEANIKNMAEITKAGQVLQKGKEETNGMYQTEVVE